MIGKLFRRSQRSNSPDVGRKVTDFNFEEILKTERAHWAAESSVLKNEMAKLTTMNKQLVEQNSSLKISVKLLCQEIEQLKSHINHLDPSASINEPAINPVRRLPRWDPSRLQKKDDFSKRNNSLNNNESRMLSGYITKDYDVEEDILMEKTMDEESANSTYSMEKGDDCKGNRPHKVYFRKKSSTSSTKNIDTLEEDSKEYSPIFILSKRRMQTFQKITGEKVLRMVVKRKELKCGEKKNYYLSVVVSVVNIITMVEDFLVEDFNVDSVSSTELVSMYKKNNEVLNINNGIPEKTDVLLEFDVRVLMRLDLDKNYNFVIKSSFTLRFDDKRRAISCDYLIQLEPTDFFCLQWVEPLPNIIQSSRRPEETRSDGSSLNSWADKSSPRIDLIESESNQAFLRVDKIIKNEMDRDEAETKLWLSYKDIRFNHYKFEKRAIGKAEGHITLPSEGVTYRLVLLVTESTLTFVFKFIKKNLSLSDRAHRAYLKHSIKVFFNSVCD